MSSFTGKFKEYPMISADNFEKENLNSVAFFLSHCHKDHMSGLDSSAFFQRLCGSKTLFLYCSETTENLLMCNASYSRLKEYIRSIPLEQQTMIPLFDENTEEQSSICVTLLPAGHCVGSVMFLFEGQHGNVLYTGDFRLSKGDVKRVPFFHANGRIKDIKSIYIDTTFCLPKMTSLPSREQSRDAIIDLIDRWFPRGPEYVVNLLCKGMYGFEYLLKEVAMKYKTKIHVSSERMAMYKYLPDMTPYFTNDGQSTRIHSCKWESERNRESDLPCGLSIHSSRKMKVLRIKPTTMWVARDTEPIPADYKRYDKGKRLWRVVHSMHASMEEIQDLVGYLRPYHVYPNVPPAGLDTLEDAFERLKGLTRIHQCDSCNQEESGEERFRENAELYCTTEEKKLELKTGPTGLLPIYRPTPDEKVLAQCKELGIEEEVSLAPLPKRRRAKISDAVLGEKKAKSTALSTCNGQADLKCKPVTQLPDFCGRKSNNALPFNSRHTVPVLKDEVRKRCEDREERQFDKTTPATSGEEVRAVGENKVLAKDINGQLNDTVRSKTIKLDRDCFENDKDGEKPVGRDARDGFSDKTIAYSKFKDEDTSCSRGDSGRISSHFVDKAKCATGMSLGLGSEGWVGGELPNGIDFNVPPSPGHVEPRPENLSFMHQSMENGELIIITKIS